MFFVSLSSLALTLAIIIVGFVSGGTFCLVGIITHEDYGTRNVSKILGYLMTGAAIGILIFDELIFDQMYHAFTSNTDQKQAYGRWNRYIFIVAVFSSTCALMMSSGAYIYTRRYDGNKDKVSEFINY